jgi:hypothetical protein
MIEIVPNIRMDALNLLCVRLLLLSMKILVLQSVQWGCFIASGIGLLWTSLWSIYSILIST